MKIAMDSENFRKHAHQMVDWMADYLEEIRDYPVLPSVSPGEIKKNIAINPPEQAESMDEIFSDFQNHILPGITHWQHPNFHAYFPANHSKPSLLAEMLTSTLGAQCMIWLTSPAATELEETVMEWLKQMLQLPESWDGVIQDTASTATLVALISAREKKSEFRINEEGFYQQKPFTVYCSDQAHSSIEKAVKIAGLGLKYLRKIPTDQNFAMQANSLEKQVNEDLQDGLVPLCVVSALGTTGSTAIDPLQEISKISSKYSMWHHVDAAFAGTALILPEKRWAGKGLEDADSFVFNPHKWMFTNFDCTAYFVKDKNTLINTFTIDPSYLKTDLDQQVNNYRDWGIQLGRRFRALKLWFVIRNFGVDGIQKKLRHHLELTQWLHRNMVEHPHFQILAPVPFNTICFRLVTSSEKDDTFLNELNKTFIDEINRSGKAFLSSTMLRDQFTVRVVIGQTEVNQDDVRNLWNLIREKSAALIKQYS